MTGLIMTGICTGLHAFAPIESQTFAVIMDPDVLQFRFPADAFKLSRACSFRCLEPNFQPHTYLGRDDRSAPKRTGFAAENCEP